MSKRKEKHGRVKYRGIVADAAKLGCSRIHLYLVLNGNRKSGSLMERYKQLTRLRPQEGTN